MISIFYKVIGHPSEATAGQVYQVYAAPDRGGTHRGRRGSWDVDSMLGGGIKND